MIELDVPNRKLNLLVDQAEIEKRLKGLATFAQAQRWLSEALCRYVMQANKGVDLDSCRLPRPRGATRIPLSGATMDLSKLARHPASKGVGVFVSARLRIVPRSSRALSIKARKSHSSISTRRSAASWFRLEGAIRYRTALSSNAT